MELIKLADLIYKKIEQLAQGRDLLKQRAIDKATAISSYDKVLALTIIKLKNGQMLDIDGEQIESPQATIMEKIAKGIIWKDKLEAEKAEAMYKAAVTNMNALTTEINALQSLLRYLEEK